MEDEVKDDEMMEEVVEEEIPEPGTMDTKAKDDDKDEKKEKSVRTKSDDDLEDKDEKKLKGTLLAQRKMMRELYTKLNGLAKIR